ncbi:MAG: hypothetical protein AB7N70_04875 [Dehalococcoidia bacterium]
MEHQCDYRAALFELYDSMIGLQRLKGLKTLIGEIDRDIAYLNSGDDHAGLSEDWVRWVRSIERTRRILSGLQQAS